MHNRDKHYVFDVKNYCALCNKQFIDQHGIDEHNDENHNSLDNDSCNDYE
jgi:hypothetical protein